MIPVVPSSYIIALMSPPTNEAFIVLDFILSVCVCVPLNICLLNTELKKHIHTHEYIDTCMQT